MRQNKRVDELQLERVAHVVTPLLRRCTQRRDAVGDAPAQCQARGELRRSRDAALRLLISSKMLGGASQIVSMIRVKCNGT